MNNNLDNILNIYGLNITEDSPSDEIPFETLIRYIKQGFFVSIFRIFVLNPDETISYQIPIEDIEINSGNYTENYQQGSRRSLSFNLINKNNKYTPNINGLWLNSKFRFDAGINYNGSDIWFTKGIFIMDDITLQREDGINKVQIKLNDKFSLLEGTTGIIDTIYELPVGSNIKEAVEGLLLTETGDAEYLDPKPVIFDSSYKTNTIKSAIKKEAGSSIGEIIIDIATQLSSEVYYNTNGNLTFVPINETIDDSIKPVIWQYSSLNKDYKSATLDIKTSEVINVVKVVGDNINGTVSSAMVENNNPSSPICVQRIKRRMETPITDNNIWSDDIALDRANYELRFVSLMKTSFSLNCTFNPLIEVNNLIELYDLEIQIDKDKLIINSISFPISSNPEVTLSCSNVKDLPFMTGRS